MNHWMNLSIQFANQRNYLDELFNVYPTIPEGIRELDDNVWHKIESAYKQKKSMDLIVTLLALDLFPIKDSYVAYLKRDPNSIKRNPNTINRLCGRLYEMGLDKIYEKCSEPKETNRQIGPLFRRWLNRGCLGLPTVNLRTFESTKDDAILDAGDAEMMHWCYEKLDYRRNKGLDFVARFKGNYIIGEAKFLTDFGGHQNAQFADALSTLTEKNVNAIKVAIMDGVLYIQSNNKMFRDITTDYKDLNIMSALVLREFLYNL